MKDKQLCMVCSMLEQGIPHSKDGIASVWVTAFLVGRSLESAKIETGWVTCEAHHVFAMCLKPMVDQATKILASEKKGTP